MELYNAWPFFKWLMNRWFGGVGKLYRQYDAAVVDMPWGMFLLTTLVNGIIFVVLAFLAIALGLGGGRYPVVGWAIFSINGLVFLNYFRIIFRELYRTFTQEREKLFDILKTK